MPKFVWTNGGDGGFEIDAPNEETAYRVAVAFRVSTGQTPEEAVRWYREHDQLIEVSGKLTNAPFEGELPDPNDG